jgi:hypothetical protein
MTVRAALRRAVIAGVIVLQAAMVVRAYGADQKVFGFQMFPESSRWTADIVRVTSDGDRVPITEPWPGGYRWAELVPSRGLSHPGADNHASAGIDSTLEFFAKALVWVAMNTPDDTDTVYLEATVVFTRNGAPPETLVLRSPERPVP